MVFFTAITCPEAHIYYYLIESSGQAWEEIIVFYMKNLRLKSHCWFAAGQGSKAPLFFVTLSSTIPGPLPEGGIEKYKVVGKGKEK